MAGAVGAVDVHGSVWVDGRVAEAGASITIYVDRRRGRARGSGGRRREGGRGAERAPREGIGGLEEPGEQGDRGDEDFRRRHGVRPSPWFPPAPKVPDTLQRLNPGFCAGMMPILGRPPSAGRVAWKPAARAPANHSPGDTASWCSSHAPLVAEELKPVSWKIRELPLSRCPVPFSLRTVLQELWGIP